MGLCRQEYWSGFPLSSPENLSHPGIEPLSLEFPVMAEEFFILLNHLGSSFKGVINLKWGSEWNIIHSDQYPYQKRKFRHIRKHQRWVNTEDRPWGDTASRQPLQAKERGLKRNQICQNQKVGLPKGYPKGWTSSLQICKKINFCCLSHPVYDFFFMAALTK